MYANSPRDVVGTGRLKKKKTLTMIWDSPPGGRAVQVQRGSVDLGFRLPRCADVQSVAEASTTKTDKCLKFDIPF